MAQTLELGAHFLPKEPRPPLDDCHGTHVPPPTELGECGVPQHRPVGHHLVLADPMPSRVNAKPPREPVPQDKVVHTREAELVPNHSLPHGGYQGYRNQNTHHWQTGFPC